jgi:hypothetical protein
MKLIEQKAKKLGIADLKLNEYSDSEDLKNGNINLENIIQYLQNPSDIEKNMNHFVIHLDKGFMFNNNVLFNHLVLSNIFQCLSIFEDNVILKDDFTILNFKNFWMVHNILCVEKGMYILFTWDKNQKYSNQMKNIMHRINTHLKNKYFKENFLSYLFSFNLNYPDKIVYSEKIDSSYTYAEKRLFLNNMNIDPTNKTKFYISRNVKRNLILPGHSKLFQEPRIIKSFIL